MDNELPIPLDLGGFQCVEPSEGQVVENGDLLVYNHGLEQIRAWAVGEVGELIEELPGYRVYRRIPVARQGSADGFPDPTAPREVDVAIHCAHATPGAPSFATIDTARHPSHLRLEPNPERAKTNDAGKPPLATLPPAGVRAVALVQQYGQQKYGDFWNYRKGMEATRQLSCAMRHIMDHMDGQDNDPESGLPHLAHAATRLLFALQNIADGKMVDDRFKRPAA